MPLFQSQVQNTSGAQLTNRRKSGTSEEDPLWTLSNEDATSKAAKDHFESRYLPLDD